MGCDITIGKNVRLVSHSFFFNLVRIMVLKLMFLHDLSENDVIHLLLSNPGDVIHLFLSNLGDVIRLYYISCGKV